MRKKLILLAIASLLIALLIIKLGGTAQEIYVSVNGKADNKGTKESPLTFDAAIEKLSKQLKEGNSDKAKINVGGGNYHFEKTIVLGSEFKGSKDSPIIITAMEGEEVVFDGSKLMNPADFSKVTDNTERELLAASAVDNIYTATITDETLIRVFSEKLMLNLTFNGKEYLPSVFPNEGYAYFVEKTVTSEVSPPAVPVGKEAHGVRAGAVPYREEGKERGWRGSLEEPRGARAKIKNDENMAGSWQQWENEISKNNTRNQLTGFIEANWLLSSQPIYAASSKDNCVHLTRALAYGWAWKKDDKPFRVFGLLCEVDQPGEWHFDTNTNKLYIYPPEQINNDTQIALSVADGFIKLDGASNVHIIGLSAKNISKGIIYDIGGTDNLVAAATISNSTALGAKVEGKNNSLKGCDLFDLNSHVNMSGGVRSTTEITAANNLVENCHIYQKNYKHEKVNILVNGVGNIFSHNLVHNSLGQAMVVNGNEHIIEYNEFFNVGYDEGDGGAIYSGADLAGYGTTYRYNFFHHLMHCPGKIERAGIHLDDGQSGAICYGNIFYKSAGKGLFAFGGSGHSMYDNIFLNNGNRGLYFVKSLGESMLAIEREIRKDPKSHHVGMKEDYVGNVERRIGKECWESQIWKDKYPTFAKVMRDTGTFGRLWPIHYDIRNNYSYDNELTNIPDENIEPETMLKNNVEKYKDINPSDFVDYDNMDFRYKNKNDFPDIQFDKIGLIVDSHRAKTPDKAHYRKGVREFFRGIESMPGTDKRIDTSLLTE